MNGTPNKINGDFRDVWKSYWLSNDLSAPGEIQNERAKAKDESKGKRKGWGRDSRLTSFAWENGQVQSG